MPTCCLYLRAQLQCISHNIKVRAKTDIVVILSKKAGFVISFR